MKKDFEHFYNVTVGLEHPRPFEHKYPILESKCESLFERIYAARMRMALRTSGDMDEEHADMLVLITAYEKMMRLLCRHFYEYGRVERLRRRRKRKPRF